MSVYRLPTGKVVWCTGQQELAASKRAMKDCRYTAMGVGLITLRTEPGCRKFQARLVGYALLILCAANDAFAQSDTPASTDAAFTAFIAGSYEGAATGAGVLMLLPDGGFTKQGYFFLADGRGLRPHGVTFILPRGISEGRHELTSPSPLNIGTVPSVRVDRDTGAAIVAADRNTSGFLELTAFPTDESKLAGSDVTGRFEFVTEDAEGRKIDVTGTFSFKAK